MVLHEVFSIQCFSAIRIGSTERNFRKMTSLSNLKADVKSTEFSERAKILLFAGEDVALKLERIAAAEQIWIETLFGVIYQAFKAQGRTIKCF